MEQSIVTGNYGGVSSEQLEELTNTYVNHSRCFQRRELRALASTLKSTFIWHPKTEDDYGWFAGLLYENRKFFEGIFYKKHEDRGVYVLFPWRHEVRKGKLELERQLAVIAQPNAPQQDVDSLVKQLFNQWGN